MIGHGTAFLIALFSVQSGAFIEQNKDDIFPACEHETVVVHHAGNDGYNFEVSGCEYNTSNGSLVKVE